jgi:hypothetical protein
MSKVWIAAIVLLLFTACTKKENSNCPDETTTFHFSNNKQVDTLWQPTTGAVFANSVAGTDIVFQYRRDTYPCGGGIWDAGYTDQLIFQVPGGSTSFDYNDSTTLANANTYFTRMCYCPNVTAQHVTGRITGTRINSNSWSLQVDVTTSAAGQDQRLTGNFTATLQ